MERSSDKHNPKLDDAMKREVAPLTDGAPVDSRAQEARESEAPGDGQPNPDAIIRQNGETPPRSLPDDQIELRRDLARFLEGKIFPATRDEIISDAESMHAPEHVVARLRRLPEGTYEGFPFVWEALGGEIEGGREH